jgi:oligoribonuclease
VNLAILDLETTGTDETAGSILEVGIIITDPDLTVLDEASWLVEPAPDHLDHMNDFVLQMHTANRLLDDLMVGPTATPDEVDTDIATFLDPHTDNGRIALAGSGVGHFDSRWIRLHLPQTAKRLTYWTYDVGVIRRFLRDLVGWAPDVDPPDKPHRALDDCRLHLTELTRYRNLFQGTQYLQR